MKAIEKMTKRELTDVVKEATERFELINTLQANGVSLKKAEATIFCSAETGYSMGGYTIYRVNGKNLCERNLTKTYRGKYRGRETYGRVVVDFTKKTLKEYCEKCSKIEILDKRISYNEIYKDEELACLRKERYSIWKDVVKILNDNITEKRVNGHMSIF